MSWIGRHAGLTLAAILTLLLALARYQGGSRAIPAPPPAHVVAPPEPAAPVAPVAKAKRKTRKKLVAALVVQPVAPAKVRGARLREKGEALGGRTPDRVDKTTETLASH